MDKRFLHRELGLRSWVAAVAKTLDQRHASLDVEGNMIDVQTFATGGNVVVAISQGPDGALYYVDLDDNLIGRWEIV